MRQIMVEEREAGLRLDKYLGRYLKEAPKSFLYRMLRKKNIVLNGKKAAGNEILSRGDEIRLYLAEETIAKFGGGEGAGGEGAGGEGAGREGAGGERAGGERAGGEQAAPPHGSACEEHAGSGGGSRASFRDDGKLAGPYPAADLDILYEDAHVLLVSKPVGMLSQKAEPGDVSLCEYLIGYLLRSGQITTEDLRTVRPSVCNRLDRNTSGIVCCGKTIAGLAAMSALLRTREVHKYYLALVMGRVEREERIEGFILKDGKSNRSRAVIRPAAERTAEEKNTGKKAGAEKPAVQKNAEEKPAVQKNGAGKPACTILRPLRPVRVCGREATLVEAELVTGRSHQIRAQLSATGHTLVGDIKYAAEEEKRFFTREVRVRTQLLHCARVEFPPLEGVLGGLSGKRVEAPLPPEFARLL